MIQLTDARVILVSFKPFNHNDYYFELDIERKILGLKSP